MPIKHLLFDLGGVLYDIDLGLTRQAFADLTPLNLSDTFFTKKGQHEIFSQFEVGEMSGQTIKAAWNKMLLGLVPHRVEQLQILKEKYPVALLSNNNALHFEYLYADCLPLFHEFDQLFFSHIIKKRKPDVESYYFTLDKLGWKAEETLFIEDSPPNLAGARAAGLQVFPIQELADFEVFFEQYK
jgi:glucose-1-phosphatase